MQFHSVTKKDSGKAPFHILCGGNWEKPQSDHLVPGRVRVYRMQSTGQPCKLWVEPTNTWVKVNPQARGLDLAEK